MHICSIEEYRAKYPDKTTAIQAIFHAPHGEIAERYYYGNDDRWKIGNDVSTFVFINGWRVVMQEITL